MIRYPKPLRPGDTIAITAPSSGITTNGHARLDMAIHHLRELGYQVVEGNCLRKNFKGASASAEERATELMRFLTDVDVAAVLPPCGGDLAIETLPLLDFEALSKLPPKWMLGFSDISTILLPLTLLSGWASAHGTVLLGLFSIPTDPLTSATMQALEIEQDAVLEQSSSSRHRVPDYSVQAQAGDFNFAPTRWKTLGENPNVEVKMRGRLIGGCLDRIPRLTGTKYGNISEFVNRNQSDGVILYLENGGLRPAELAITLMGLRLNGWFDSLNGILIGRNSAVDAASDDELSYLDVLRSSFRDAPYPILIDTDIGHMQPQMTLINGALAEVNAKNGSGTISQQFI